MGGVTSCCNPVALLLLVRDCCCQVNHEEDPPTILANTFADEAALWPRTSTAAILFYFLLVGDGVVKKLLEGFYL